MSPQKRVLRVYNGSNGEATKALYADLDALGAAGRVAVNLLRACKASERAKTYRGGVRGRGSYRGMAYQKKEWSLNNLCKELTDSAAACGLCWGWGVDDKQAVHRHVLYVDLPTGQASFHTGGRGEGPAYGGEWDGVPGQSAGRICAWAGRLLTAAETA